jgi:hypothetical protein
MTPPLGVAEHTQLTGLRSGGAPAAGSRRPRLHEARPDAATRRVSPYMYQCESPGSMRSALRMHAAGSRWLLDQDTTRNPARNLDLAIKRPITRKTPPDRGPAPEPGAPSIRQREWSSGLRPPSPQRSRSQRGQRGNQKQDEEKVMHRVASGHRTLQRKTTVTQASCPATFGSMGRNEAERCLTYGMCRPDFGTGRSTFSRS